MGVAGVFFRPCSSGGLIVIQQRASRPRRPPRPQARPRHRGRVGCRLPFPAASRRVARIGDETRRRRIPPTRSPPCAREHVISTRAGFHSPPTGKSQGAQIRPNTSRHTDLGIAYYYITCRIRPRIAQFDAIRSRIDSATPRRSSTSHRPAFGKQESEGRGRRVGRSASCPPLRKRRGRRGRPLETACALRRIGPSKNIPQPQGTGIVYLVPMVGWSSGCSCFRPRRALIAAGHGNSSGDAVAPVNTKHADGIHRWRRSGLAHLRRPRTRADRRNPESDNAYYCCSGIAPPHL